MSDSLEGHGHGEFGIADVRASEIIGGGAGARCVSCTPLRLDYIHPHIAPFVLLAASLFRDRSALSLRESFPLSPFPLNERFFSVLLYNIPSRGKDIEYVSDAERECS